MVTSSAAAETAFIGMVRALDESNPRMVAARTAQAIAVAVSTSRSYAAFVAAVTAAESCALLLVEDARDYIPLDRCTVRSMNAVHAAANTAEREPTMETAKLNTVWRVEQALFYSVVWSGFFR